MSSEKLLDIELLQGYLDNLRCDIVRQMVELYEQQSGIYLSDISKAIADDSQQEWQEQCHKMKGAAGSAGLISVHKKLVEIEKQPSSSTEKSVLFSQLTDLNTEALKAVNNWLQNHQTQ